MITSHKLSNFWPSGKMKVQGVSTQPVTFLSLRLSAYKLMLDATLPKVRWHHLYLQRRLPLVCSVAAESAALYTPHLWVQLAATPGAFVQHQLVYIVLFIPFSEC